MIIGYLTRKQVFQMFAHLLLTIMLEAAETTRIEQNKNNHNLSITHAVGFVTLLASLIHKHIFFLLQRKFLAKTIGHTINLCNFRLWKRSDKRFNVMIQHYKFNTFIAIFLFNNRLYWFLYRTHVKLL